jgi:hypothetical protein
MCFIVSRIIEQGGVLMNKIDCTIYDCEFDLYHKGVIVDNRVYALDNDGNQVPANESVCEYVDFSMVQFYTGYYDKSYYEPKKDDSRWGYFNFSTGEIVVKPIYDYGWPFYGDRAKVKRNMKHGFIDPEGREVVRIEWDDAGSSFYPGLCWVKKGDKFGYIDKYGVEVITPQFELVERFELIGECNNNPMYAALVKKDGKYGYIDEKGEYIFEPSFDDARRFWSRGYAPVNAFDKWGFIDGKGNFAAAFQFEDVGEEDCFSAEDDISKEKGLSEEYIHFYTVKKDGRWGLLNTDLDIIMQEDKKPFVIYRGKRIYIKDGRVTSIQKLKTKKSEGV